MGYYSDYAISIEPDVEDFGDVLEAVSDGYTFEYYSDEYRMNGKWYSAEADIEKLSRDYPEHTITYEAVGEEGEGQRYDIKNGVVSNRYARGWEKVPD